MYSSSIYAKSPRLAQELLITIRSIIKEWLREGGALKKVSKEIAETQWLDVNAIEELQSQRIVEILKHAYLNVPYYTKLISSSGKTSADIDDLCFLDELLVLNKIDVNNK